MNFLFPVSYVDHLVVLDGVTANGTFTAAERNLWAIDSMPSSSLTIA